MLSCSRDALSWWTLAPSQAVFSYPIKWRLFRHFIGRMNSIWLRLVIHPYALEYVFLHTLLRMTVFIHKPKFALHIFPSNNLPHKQTRCALSQRMRCTSRLGVSPSKGLPNLFHKEITKSKLLSTNTLLMTSGYFNPIYIYFCFHNLTIQILHLCFSTFRLKGGGQESIHLA